VNGTAKITFEFRDENARGIVVDFQKRGKTLYSKRIDPYMDEAEEAVRQFLKLVGEKDDAKSVNQVVRQLQKQLRASDSESLEIELLGFGDLLKANPKLRQPVIDGVLRHGETANLIAATKVGKSWLAADLAMAVATGQPWLKNFDTTQGKVVIVDNELHIETLAYRLDAIATQRQYDRKTLTKNLFPICLRGVGGDIYSLEKKLSRLAAIEPVLIILDAFYRFIPSGTSENDNAGMMAVYNELDRYAKRLDCCFVVVHHASKGSQAGKAVTDVGSGAGSMSRAADTHLVIRPHEQEGLSVIDAATRSFPPLEPMTLFFTWPLWHVSPVEPSTHQLSDHERKRTQQRTEDVSAVVAKFADGKPFSEKRVAKLIACGDTRAANIIKHGIETGKIKQHKKLKTKRAKNKVQTYKVVTTGTATSTATSTWNP
jgi:RecA-family ATPase